MIKQNEEILPDGIRGWSWGAFLLNWIWAIFNKTWLGLLCFVPIVGVAVPFILGFKGREWAWKNDTWDSVEHFNRVQNNWSKWGVSLTLGFILFFTVGAASIYFVSGMEGFKTTEISTDSVKMTSASIPSKEAQLVLTNQSMNNFSVAVQNKNMEHFYKSISNIWQSQFTIEKLNESFAPIIATGIDLTKLNPQELFLNDAIIGEDGILLIKGYYPQHLTFEHKYVYEGTEWKLLGFSINITETSLEKKTLPVTTSTVIVSDFSGKWSTDIMGDVTIEQTNNKVIGKYQYEDEDTVTQLGKFDAVIEGKAIKGDWHERPSKGKGDNSHGDFELALSRDATTLKGWYRNEGEKEKEDWILVRK
jgi:hypothetical protein